MTNKPEPEDILPPTNEPEPYQQAGTRIALLVLMCAHHTENVWVLDPTTDEVTGGMGAVGEALAHFIMERDPSLHAPCVPAVSIAWGFHLAPRHMWESRDALAKRERRQRRQSEQQGRARNPPL